MADVSVVYHFDEPKRIDVDILVPADGPIIAALPVFPHGEWVVTWNLKGDGSNAPTFEDQGIQLEATNLANGLNFYISQTNAPGDSSFTINIHNNCVFNHNVPYLVSGNRGDRLLQRIESEDFLHDPSISVVTDPVGG